MPAILGRINDVAIRFSPQARNQVAPRIVQALQYVIRADIAPGHRLSRIYISSANDQHRLPSRHVQGEGKAVDISRVNGLKMATHHGSDAGVRAIVAAIQTAFEGYPYRRENFGPAFKEKLGEGYQVPGHLDHIHLSVN